MEKRYYCGICGYIYDPEKGEPRKEITPGTSFDDYLIYGDAQAAEQVKLDLE